MDPNIHLDHGSADPATGDEGFAGALAQGPAHRRASGMNPGNRFEAVRLHVLGEELDRQRNGSDEGDVAKGGEGEAGIAHFPAALRRVERQVYVDETRTIINRVDRTSDVPFDWTLNPYRGCEHGCIYCYARTYHEYLGFSCGLDFETKIVAKLDAAQLLKRELANPNWKPEPIVMSAITDIYQPLEHKMRLARQCLEILADCNQPVSTMTKSALVLRDIDLWQRLAAVNAGRVTITLVTLDAALAKTLEPRATDPAGRLRAIRELSAAGIPVTVNIAPIIPGLTDAELPSILQAVAEAGARRASWILLRLPYQLKDVFTEWLTRNLHPDRARKVQSLLRQMSHGKLYDAGPGRHRGHGVFADQIETTFKMFARKHGLTMEMPRLSGKDFRRPEAEGQLRLF